MTGKTFERARAFIRRNARPLDLARWQYHFEGGGKDAVLSALAAYQNADGGFGHALEADAWNPNSAPIQAWAATEILREIGCTGGAHPIVQGLLRYLAGGQDFEGRVWRNTVSSNNDHPHAPWWNVQSDSACYEEYNPTACLAGFIVRFADRGGEAHRLGRRIAREACDAYFAGDLLGDMHTALCYVRLWQYCAEAGATDVVDLPVLEARLRAQVAFSITRDTAAWETGYVCKPSQFFSSRESVFYGDNRELADYECEHIVRTQLDDGSWPVPWTWSGYPDAWAISRNWWKGHGAISNMHYLKGMGRLDMIAAGGQHD